MDWSHDAYVWISTFSVAMHLSQVVGNQRREKFGNQFLGVISFYSSTNSMIIDNNTQRPLPSQRRLCHDGARCRKESGQSVVCQDAGDT